MAKQFDPRTYMQVAIDEMKKSIAEKRIDKSTPKVGSVLIDPTGRQRGTTFRGELRNGDHAEFTLIERKLRAEDITGTYLFTTLEPCAPGARKYPKLGCAERIVNARIKKVWVGIEDPDPTVDRKGIKYLQEAGIEVEMFDKDLQEIIIEENKDFLESAKQRSLQVREAKSTDLTTLEKELPSVTIEEFSEEALQHYIKLSGLDMKPTDPAFLSLLSQQELIIDHKPTGLGILLFGKTPRLRYPQAVVKFTYRQAGNDPAIQDFDDALVLIPDQIEKVLRKSLPKTISREKFERIERYDFPIEVLREAIINALVHRDYEDARAKILIFIDDEKIEVKSPGLPVKPIHFGDFQAFRAPSLSRNPKIMAVFNSMKYAEERGIGMSAMQSLPEKYDLPRPDISWQDPYLSITFPRTKKYLERNIPEASLTQLKDDEKEGLFFLREKDGVSTSEYARHFNIDPKKAQRHLAKFKQLKLVKIKGKSTATRYYFNK